jgi:hypothetical protein
MQNRTPHFHGRYDFSAFCANRGDGSTPNPFKTMGEMKFEKVNRSIGFTLVSDGFSYEMVRMLVGSFVMLDLGSALGSGTVTSGKPASDLWNGKTPTEGGFVLKKDLCKLRAAFKLSVHRFVDM